MYINPNDRIIQHPSPKKRTNKPMYISLLLLGVLILAIGFFFFDKEEKSESASLPAPVPEPITIQPNVEPKPEIEPEPIPEPEPAIVSPQVETPQVTVEQPKPLPTLNESDPYVHDYADELSKEIDGAKINALLVEQNVLRQFVVFVDNIAQGQVARKASPIKAPKQPFPVADITNKTYLSPDGYLRYNKYVNTLTSLNEQQLVDTYNSMKPLLNEAFDELGYPDITFDDRVNQAINVLLETPIIENSIELYSYSVNYKFVDPKLEALPEPQKVLVRMGPENTKKIKQVLRKLQLALNQ